MIRFRNSEPPMKNLRKTKKERRWLWPESIGWMPFKRTEKASKGVKLETAWMIVESEVKSWLSSTLNIIITAAKTMLINRLSPFTTITANLANRGCAAPSSLLTRTLQIQKHSLLIVLPKFSYIMSSPNYIRFC